MSTTTIDTTGGTRRGRFWVFPVSPLGTSTHTQGEGSNPNANSGGSGGGKASAPKVPVSVVYVPNNRAATTARTAAHAMQYPTVPQLTKKKSGHVRTESRDFEFEHERHQQVAERTTTAA